MTADVVLATAVPTRAHGGERLLQLARWLTRRGISVEIIALGEGTRPELAEFRAVAPTLVVDRFRRRGLARAPHLLGMQRATTGWKTVRLRQMMERRSGATFVAHDPVAAALLRYAPSRPRRIIAAFPEASWSVSQMRDEDRESLATADGWITCDDTQTAEVRQWFMGPVVQLGDALRAGALIDRSELPPVQAAEPGSTGVVVLLSPMGMWDSIDHAVEIAWQLRRAVPTASLRWVVDDASDQWLARHDLRHAGLDEAVQVVSSTDTDVLSDVAAVVRTGYEPVHTDLVVAAALHGVPVVGMCTTDLPDAAPQTESFGVESLITSLEQLMLHPGERTRSGAELKSALAHLDLDRHIATIVDLLIPGRS